MGKFYSYLNPSNPIDLNHILTLIYSLIRILMMYIKVEFAPKSSLWIKVYAPLGAGCGSVCLKQRAHS